MNSAFNSNVRETVRRLTLTTAILGSAFFAAAYASSAAAAPGASIPGASAPTSTQTINGQVMPAAPKVLKVRRARRINAGAGVGGAACWVTYEGWGEVFYGTCPY